MNWLENKIELAACVLLLAGTAFAQGGGGTLTGTITDPAGAVIAGAAVEARNTDTGTIFRAVSTTTGNYTVSNLPVGPYELDVTAPGFKKFVRRNLTIQAAQTLPVNVTMDIGATTESVTVTAEATMLKTETGDISQNVNVETLDSLPMLAVGASQAGSSGIRNPNNVLNVVPGTYYVPNSQVKINGAPTNSYNYHIEGMDATNVGLPYAGAETQPSVDAIQEVAIQTSNFAPEFGFAGGGYFNVTMKSGTNQLHGTVYDYFINEVLNAGTPFTDDGRGNLVRPPARRNDYGFTVGGPVFIPKVYNGHDKTFFFFNFEQFRETQHINNIPDTVPVAAYRNGDFSQAEAAVGNKILGTDVLGRPIPQNGVYDPATRRTDPASGQVVADLFPGNVIPASRFSPIALKIQNNVPLPTQAGLTNNYLPTYPSVRHTTIPALKIDHNINANSKLSFYWSYTHTDSQYSPIYGNSEGFPDIISQARGTFIHSHVERLNYDNTLTPTVLLHLGAGYQENDFFDDAPILDFNAEKTYGLKGATVNRNTPVFNGFCSPTGHGTCTGAGGMYNIGPPGQTHTYWEKPTGTASLTWVKGNHTIKGGAEVFFESVPTVPYTNTNGAYTFSANETMEPYLTQTRFAGGSPGFPYASFLLGDVDSFNIAAGADYHTGKQQWGFFLQDSWKATRDLTLTYGLRYDYGTYYNEQYGRALDFSPTLPNPNAGNHPGGWIYGATCHCDFAHNYPYALAPRLGLAYQVTPKTVIRAGWGLIYAQTAITSLGIVRPGIANSTTVTSPGLGIPAMTLDGGIPSNQVPTWPDFSAGILPLRPGTVALSLPGGVGYYDSNAGRPARQNEWSIGIEREITPNLVLEASYVANRGVWWQAPGLMNLNVIDPAVLAAHGIDLSRPADQALLLSPLGSSAAQARGLVAPYAGFPLTQSVAQALRPFPQFGNIPAQGDPRGRTWYDSLQAKLTKRLSHNLMVNGAFTWQKSLQEGVDTNSPLSLGGQLPLNVLNGQAVAKSISEYDKPFILQISAQYTTPKLPGPKPLSWLLKDWAVGTLLVYSSGLPIPTPLATTSVSNQLFQSTLMNRVPGQPLYNVDINCHCYNPGSTLVLNSKAWTNPPAGQFGASALYYDDFRYQRHPQENMNLGRTWKLHERFSLQLRVEFNNIFNRTWLNDPSVTNPLAPATHFPNGYFSGGFGYINLGTTSTQFGQPRNGDIVMKLTF
ncbi:MAG TPA: TonB-dependent receptor [Bryobacteraceae bacterium]|nr:TonB-dependent receptor [Bryobacteraceae bacterium]